MRRSVTRCRADRTFRDHRPRSRSGTGVAGSL